MSLEGPLRLEGPRVRLKVPGLRLDVPSWTGGPLSESRGSPEAGGSPG